jgi:hypothetical protein
MDFAAGHKPLFDKAMLLPESALQPAPQMLRPFA